MLVQLDGMTGCRELIVEPARYPFVMPPRDSMFSANRTVVQRTNPSVRRPSRHVRRAHHRLSPRWPSGGAALDLISPSEKLVCRSFTLGRRNSASIVQRE